MGPLVYHETSFGTALGSETLNQLCDLTHVTVLASWDGCHHVAVPQGFLEEQTGEDIVDLDEIGAQLSTPSPPFSFFLVSLMAIALQWETLRQLDGVVASGVYDLKLPKHWYNIC